MLKVELEQLVSTVRFTNGRFSGDELAVLIVRQMQAVMANQLNIVCAPGYETFGSNKQCKAPRSKNFYHIKQFLTNYFKTITSPLFQMFNQHAPAQATADGGNHDQLKDQPTQQDPLKDQPTRQLEPSHQELKHQNQQPCRLQNQPQLLLPQKPLVRQLKGMFLFHFATIFILYGYRTYQK